MVLGVSAAEEGASSSGAATAEAPSPPPVAPPPAAPPPVADQGPGGSGRGADPGQGNSGQGSPGGAVKKASWSCNATGWVRVCGYAGVCSNQMVFGQGLGTERLLAEQMARNACQGMAIAKGGSAVCSVACSAR